MNVILTKISIDIPIKITLSFTSMSPIIGDQYQPFAPPPSFNATILAIKWK